MQESEILINHIQAVCDKISYQEAEIEGLSILVPRNDLINAAAECAPPDVSIDLITFDYWRYRGIWSVSVSIYPSLHVSLSLSGSA